MIQSRRSSPDSARRAPELPRVTLDTRMPRAPALGGRTIMVDRPPRRVKAQGASSELLIGTLALAALVAICWKLLRRSDLRVR